MSTYGEVQTNIRNMLSRADLNSLITEAIQRAIQTYEREPFYFNERSMTLTVSSGASTYTLSTSFVGMLSDPTITIGGSILTLDQISKAEYDRLKVTTQTSQPSEYCLYAGTFNPYPPPDSSYVAVLNYTTRLSTLSAAADTNAWTTQAQDLIEGRSLWWLHSMKTRNYAAAQAAKSSELEALRFLRNESVGKKATGRIRSTQF